MNGLKKFAVALLCCVCFAAEPVATDTAAVATAVLPKDAAPAVEPFTHIFVSVEGGEIYPFGDLIDAVDNAFYGGLGFRYTYLENIDGFVHFNYSYFKVAIDGVPFPGVHQFTGRLGVDFKWQLISPVIPGVGFTCNWTRADQDSLTSYKGRGGMLLDNETEFGWFARINLPFLQTENYRLGLNLLWEELWTLPKRSNMLSAGIYFERRIW